MALRGSRIVRRLAARRRSPGPGPRVIDVASPPQREAGPDVADWDSPGAVVVMVHWSAATAVSRSVSESLREFVAAGYQVAFCSTSEVAGPLSWPHGLPEGVAVYRRPNVGYDFGSWAAMLHSFPQLRRADRLLLVNDSLVGPFASIGGVLEEFATTEAEVWGLVSSSEYTPHLQSHFVGYRSGVLANGPLADFWEDIRLQPTKLELIFRYELGQRSVIDAAGYRVASAYSGDLIFGEGKNPTVRGWREMLLHGFPYVKREMVLTPPLHDVPDAVDVRDAVKLLYGEDVLEWV